MKQKFLAFTLLSLTSFFVMAQEKQTGRLGIWQSYLHIEGGLEYPTGIVKESLAIRQNISNYYVDQYESGYISSETFGTSYGARYELFNPELKIGISTGLKFLQISCDISGYSAQNTDFFYLRYNSVNTETKFARVKNLNEKVNSLSIPIEVRYVPFQFRNLHFFAKVGAEISPFKLSHKNNIVFQENSMANYSNVVLESITGSTQKSYYSFYGSLGIVFGDFSRTCFSFEVSLPSVFQAPNYFNLIDVTSYQTIKFSLQFPLSR